MKILLSVITFFLIFPPIELEKRKFLNDRVEILVPKDFKQMSSLMLELKYKGQNKPTLVLTDEDGTVNVALNLLPNAASESVIESYKNSIKTSFQKSFPDADWKSDAIKIINGRKVGFLKLITDAIDQRVYNALFITHCEGKLLVGTFNCTEKLLPKWEETSDKIIESLKVE